MHLKLVATLMVVGTLGRCALGVASDYDDLYDYDYTYGDLSLDYEGEDFGLVGLRAVSHVATPEVEVEGVDGGGEEDKKAGTKMPLCCPKNLLYNINNCSQPPTGWIAQPTLTGEPSAQFVYKGFPKCKENQPVGLYQKDIFFSKGKAYLPSAIHLTPIPPEKFCVTKVYDKADPEQCEIHQTKVYVCIEKEEQEPGVYWTGITFAHLFVLLTLLAFFFVRDLRSMQGQYMICFLISLLVYNICLLPGSVLSLSISFVSCVSLGAVKYFFFCGVILWFNVICFDVWRTLKNRQDVGSRRRFLCYSLYCWGVGAILTTVVLVLPYILGLERDLSLMEKDPDVCKLKTDMNMILLLVAWLLMLLNLLFLSLAASHICSYPRFGNGLPRCEATLSLKQGWKLFAIMIVHTITDVPDDIFDVKVVDLWRYVLLESVAIFAVFAYRKTVIRTIFQSCCCAARCAPQSDLEMNHVQEKDQLTNGC